MSPGSGTGTARGAGHWPAAVSVLTWLLRPEVAHVLGSLHGARPPEGVASCVAVQACGRPVCRARASRAPSGWVGRLMLGAGGGEAGCNGPSPASWGWDCGMRRHSDVSRQRGGTSAGRG